MAQEKSQCEERGAGADAPGRTMPTEFSQSELDTAKATLEPTRESGETKRAHDRIPRPALARYREGQILLDQMVLNRASVAYKDYASAE